MRSIAILAIMVIFPGCANDSTVNGDNKDLPKGSDSKVPVVVTFNPMKEFVKAIGKDKVHITTMIPTGMVPHNFKPRKEELSHLKAAKLFVYNGMEIGEWVDETLENINNKDLIVVEASKGVEFLQNPETKAGKYYGNYDPYTWLSLKNAQIASKDIKEALVKIDPKNKDYYEKNYDDFSADLDNLYTEYKRRFSQVSKKVVLTGHPAFAYLCREFGLEQVSIENYISKSVPLKEEINKLSKYFKDNSIKVVLVENGENIDILNALERDVGIEVKTTYCMEKGQSDKSYIDSMRINLDNIYASLAK